MDEDTGFDPNMPVYMGAFASGFFVVLVVFCCVMFRCFNKDKQAAERHGDGVPLVESSKKKKKRSGSQSSEEAETAV